MRVLLPMLGVGAMVVLAGWLLLQHSARRFGHVSREKDVAEAPEATFALWFAQRPQRIKQRDLAVHVMRAMGLPGEECTKLIVATTSKVWGKRPESFGAALADEIEKRAKWADPAEDLEKREAQDEAKRLISEIADQLRTLDRT